MNRESETQKFEGKDEMMGCLCLCPPAVCRPSALTYSCRPRSSDADNLRILRSNSYRACSQENDKYGLENDKQ